MARRPQAPYNGIELDELHAFIDWHLSANPVHTELFNLIAEREIGHIALADRADLFVIPNHQDFLSAQKRRDFLDIRLRGFIHDHEVEGAGAERKVVNRSAEELEKLRRIVGSAVGIQSGTDNPRGDAITLEELPFNDRLATSVAHEFEQQQKHELWWGIARGAIYPGLALVALLVLLRLFKRTPIQEIQLGVPVGRLMAAQKAAGNGHTLGGESWGAEAPGIVSVDVLNRLIKENPANMTQAIREWMDKGRSAKS
jgi:hypothetical protein